MKSDDKKHLREREYTDVTLLSAKGDNPKNLSNLIKLESHDDEC